MTKLSGIYGILPSGLSNEALLEKAEAALKGGIRILQFRDKKSGYAKGLKRAKLLRELTTQYDATFLVNDSLQMARESGADGVHMGKDDLKDITKIREQADDNFIIGITCRADAAFAKAALESGASYVSFGAIFPSQTKTDVPVIGLPRLAKARTLFPNANICAIGGIREEALPAIKIAGADMAAVISGLFDDDAKQISTKATQLVEIWHNAPSA